jgi:hypothetical protein
LTSLGTKLQSAYTKVNTKLGTQDGDIVIRKKTTVPAAEFGRPNGTPTTTNVTITAGVKVGRVKAYEVVPSGELRLDDLKLIIPANLVTETQLDKAQIVYGGKTYSVVSKSPTEIYGGVPVQWKVIGRLEA